MPDQMSNDQGKGRAAVGASQRAQRTILTAMLGSKLANSDVGRTQCSNRICLQESATPLDTNFNALKLVLASQLGPVSIEFDSRKG